MTKLKDKLHNRTATAAVIGLGYVGLPLAMEIVGAGFTVIGVDIDKKKVRSLEEGKSYILDVGNQTIQNALLGGKFSPTHDFEMLRKSDTISICVPTPLSKSKDPDISFILLATEQIRKCLRPGHLGARPGNYP